MKFAAGLAAFLLCSAFVAAQNPQVEWVRGTDFSRFHTYTWAYAAYPIQDPDANLAMARAVNDELEAKGLQFIPPDTKKFDVFVTYQAKINPDPNDGSRKLISLIVRIFSSANDSVIWRAGGTIALGNDKEQNRKNVRALLAEMFRQYPPS